MSNAPLWNIEPARSGRRVIVTFPYVYNKTLWNMWLNIIRSVPDRKWDKAKKQWTIPINQVNPLISTLNKHGIPYRLSEKELQERIEALESIEQNLVDARFYDGEPFEIHGLLTTPKTHQYAGIKFLSSGSALLADDRGVGKTLTSIAAALMVEADPVLVVCLSTLKWNWEKELRKHTNETYQIIHGNSSQRQKQWESNARFLICGYETVRQDIDIIKKKKFKVVIADEATKFKNQKALTTKSVKSIKAEYKWPLTGTPLENRLEELHSIIDWVQPGLLGSLYWFLDRYAIKNWFGSVIGYKPEGIKEIRKKIAPYILRRTKEEVLPDLPPKMYENRVVEFSEAEKREYRELAKEVLQEVQDAPNLALTRALRAKQYTSLPIVLGYKHEGPKVRELEALLEEDSDDKFLIFSEFATVARWLAERFNAPCITGETPQENRQGIIDTFNETPSQKLLVCSGVTSYGVEITGANVVVHFDTPWNPAVKEQREDRAHRIGQTRPVNIIRLMVLNSIDDRIDKVIAHKLKLRADILEDLDYEPMMSKMSKTDWSKILGD